MNTIGLAQLHAPLTEKVLRAIGEQVLRELTFEKTVGLMCRQFVEILDYPLIWIGTKEPDGAITVRAVGGSLGHLVEHSGGHWKEKPKEQGASAKAIHDNAVIELHGNDLDQLEPQCILRERGIQFGLAIPLTIRNQVLGVCHLYAHPGQKFEPFVITLLKRLAGELSLGLFLAREYDSLRLQGAAVSSTEQAVCITNPEGCIEWVNEAYCRLMGYEVEEVIGTLLPSFPSDDIGSRLGKGQPSFPPGHFWKTEFLKPHRDGRVFSLEQVLTPLLDERGLIKNFVSVLQDITARKQLEAQMVYRAHHDPLTDLPNRVLFQDRLGQAMAWARRQGRLACIMFLDLDGFKQMNDEFGHGTGDKILQMIAVRLRQSVRATDTVARLSGDEFTVILQDIQRVQDVNRVAQKLLDHLGQPMTFDGQTLFTKTSIGLALYPLDGTDPDALLQRADRAMYKAKELGGQCYWFASQELNLQLAQDTIGMEKSGYP